MDKPQSAILEPKHLEARYEEIRSVYLSDQRPWVVGYSGGKDSTTALQLIWHALAKLPKEQLVKPLFIISSDTLVETPKIVDYINSSLKRMNEAAARLGLPFSAHKVMPEIGDTFWVNLIGRGYPAPSTQFRWCTERMKIQPANRFILDKVARYGEVVVVLGVRTSESATRAQVMSLHRMKDSVLSRHTSLSNAFVYTPIEDFSVDDVWTYLLQVPSPWGNNNRDLVTMYRNAQAGECPLVVDQTTPSCGNSRFGCWTCTVVERDKASEGLLASGNPQMKQLLEFRETLVHFRDPENGFRDMVRKNGAEGPGPLKLESRKELLTKLIALEEETGLSIISEEELHWIQKFWNSARGPDSGNGVASILSSQRGYAMPSDRDD